MTRNQVITKHFKEMMDAELDQLNAEFGADFARTARSAFSAAHMFLLLNIALSLTAEEAEMNMPKALEGIAGLVGSMLADVAHNLTHEQIQKATAWADRMVELRDATTMSMGAPLQ